MIFNRDRIAKLSGLMVESKDGSDKAKAKASDFGGGKIEDELFLNGEVTTEGAHEDEADMAEAHDDEMSEADEEKAVREMIQAELSAAKMEMEDEMKEEQAVREAVRKEIRSVLRARGVPARGSRGVALGGTGFGFKR